MSRPVGIGETLGYGFRIIGTALLIAVLGLVLAIGAALLVGTMDSDDIPSAFDDGDGAEIATAIVAIILYLGALIIWAAGYFGLMFKIIADANTRANAGHLGDGAAAGAAPRRQAPAQRAASPSGGYVSDPINAGHAHYAVHGHLEHGEHDHSHDPHSDGQHLRCPKCGTHNIFRPGEQKICGSCGYA